MGKMKKGLVNGGGILLMGWGKMNPNFPCILFRIVGTNLIWFFLFYVSCNVIK